MIFWFVGGVLIMATTIILLSPIYRARATAQQAGLAQAVFVDQLSEVDRDEFRGIISGEEAASARIEVKRRMLNESKREAAQRVPTAVTGRWLLVALAIIAPALGLGGYTMLGSPQLPSIPLAERQAERDEAIQVANLAERLKNQLLSDENSPADGWVLLGQTYMRMSRFSDATWAFGTLINRGDVSPVFYAMYAESMIAADDGIVTPKAAAALDHVLESDPLNVAAIYYKSIEFDQVGDTRAAFEILRDRIELENAFQPWMETLVAHANWLGEKLGGERVTLPAESAIAPGPSAADVAAAGEMSEEDRQAFVRSMVERLADQLAEAPDDLDGWLRLARAYSVLGEAQKAQNAFGQAERLSKTLSPDDPRRQVIEAGLQGN